MPVVLGDDVESAADQVRPFIALYAGGMGAKGANFHRDVLDRLGYSEACDEIQAHYLAGDRARATAAVPLELVQDIALVGTADDIRAQLPAWEADRHHHDARPGRPAHAAGDRGRSLGLTLTVDDDYAEAVLDLVEPDPAGPRDDLRAHRGDRRRPARGHRRARRRGGPRQVGTVLGRTGSDVPWWRVVNTVGRPPERLLQRALEELRAERHAAVRGRHARRPAAGDLVSRTTERVPSRSAAPTRRNLAARERP